MRDYFSCAEILFLLGIEAYFFAMARRRNLMWFYSCASSYRFHRNCCDQYQLLDRSIRRVAATARLFRSHPSFGHIHIIYIYRLIASLRSKVCDAERTHQFIAICKRYCCGAVFGRRFHFIVAISWRRKLEKQTDVAPCISWTSNNVFVCDECDGVMARAIKRYLYTAS